jgi:hypothetical protein
MDIADQADIVIEGSILDECAAISRQVRCMPIGEAGICEECEEYSGRLVNGLCSRCRDNLAAYYKRAGRGQ